MSRFIIEFEGCLKTPLKMVITQNDLQGQKLNEVLFA